MYEIGLGKKDGKENDIVCVKESLHMESKNELLKHTKYFKG